MTERGTVNSAQITAAIVKDYADDRAIPYEDLLDEEASREACVEITGRYTKTGAFRVRQQANSLHARHSLVPLRRNPAPWDEERRRAERAGGAGAPLEAGPGGR